MSALRNCPACGRKFLDGKRALVPGQLGRLSRKLVCRKCAAGAERIVVSPTASTCVVATCQEAAQVCAEHHRATLERVRHTAVAEAVGRLRSYTAAHAVTTPKEDGIEYAAGFTAGLAAALATVERREP
jgi:hypothetical protein